MRFIAALFLSLALVGCDSSTELPTVNLPSAFRQQNWVGWKGEGSCVHAAIVNLFHWQGKHDWAYYWRRKYSNGETPDAIVGDPRSNLADKLTREGIRFAYTTRGNVDFLEWACSTRRGCGVTVMGGRHMVTLVHFDRYWAGLLDSNHPEEFIWVPRDQFIAEWQNSNGWAVTPIYTPAPPLGD